MQKFILGFVIGILVAGLIGVIVIFSAIRIGNRGPSVSAGSVLLMHLEGDIPEQAPVDVPIPFIQGQTPATILDNWKTLNTAAGDARIKAVMLEPRGLTVGWAKMQELRSQILNFKKSGKPVYAFLKGPGAREYYIASAADAVYMAPEEELDLKGLRAELMYFKGTLDKLGIGLEFEHVGKYKDAPDQFTKTSPSPETLEVTNQILDQYYGDLVAVIAQGRKKTPEQIRAAIDQGPFVGKEALELGLVDGLMFEDQVYGKASLDKAPRIGDRSYSKAISTGQSGKKIAVVTQEGDITRGSTNEDGLSDNGITATSAVKVMREVEDDSSIAAVILRIDSPGGDGIASDDILHEAKRLSEKKPTVISMSDLAASGGYFIAMTGDPIVAYPNTLTGSIGVFFGRVNLKGLYDKIGVSTAILKRGKYADIDTSTGPLTEDQRAKLRREIEGFYHGFVQRVADGRKRPYDQVEPLAQGRVWLGAQAKQNGLVDELGGLDKAIELVKAKAKIAPGEKFTLVTYPPRRSIFDLLMNRGGESEVEAKMIRAVVGKLPIHALSQGGMLRLMPFTIEVK